MTYSNPAYGPWELSMDRANTVRNILSQYGLSDEHISSVEGRATADPLFPNDPYLAANDRGGNHRCSTSRRRCRRILENLRAFGQAYRQVQHLRTSGASRARHLAGAAAIAFACGCSHSQLSRLCKRIAFAASLM